MPAALDLDWSAIRLLVIATGLRPAIRSLGYEGTSTAEAIMRRCSREGWLTDVATPPLPPPTMRLQPPSTVRDVRTPAEALIAQLRDDMVQTRLGQSRLTRRATAKMERLDDDQLLADGGQTLLATAKHAALVHGWADAGPQRVTVCLQAIDTGDLAIAPPDLSDDVIDV